jgi:hypothetical protein
LQGDLEKVLTNRGRDTCLLLFRCHHSSGMHSFHSSGKPLQAGRQSCKQAIMQTPQTLLHFMRTTKRSKN